MNLENKRRIAREWAKRDRILNRDKWLERDRKRYLNDREAMCAKSRKWYYEHRDRALQKSRLWRKQNPLKAKVTREKHRRAHRKTDRYRFEHALRMRIWTTIRNQTKGLSRKCNKTTSLLGCSMNDFKIYLESRFEPGMSWENFGQVWHMDHIMPCAIFDLSKPEHQKRCFHFSNIRPCFASENLKKGSKVTTPQFNLI